MKSPTTTDRIRGCLLGGAVGDALGAPVEFLSLAEIRRRFGPEGIQDFAEAYGRIGAITDDTQMTLFTAEGLLRAWVRAQERGMVDIPGVVHHAYLRWLLTQGERPTDRKVVVETNGWLYGVRELHARRAPGNTCLGALKQATSFGGPAVAANTSKGCGGVMRVAPVGLMAPLIGDDERVFALANDTAALTHGHRTGSLAAGYLAVTIAALVRSENLFTAMVAADRALSNQPDHAEVAEAVDAARRLTDRGPPSPERIETLGGGWVAEEALAISLYCAMVASDFAAGVRLAANHSRHRQHRRYNRQPSGRAIWCRGDPARVARPARTARRRGSHCARSRRRGRATDEF